MTFTFVCVCVCVVCDIQETECGCSKRKLFVTFFPPLPPPSTNISRKDCCWLLLMLFLTVHWEKLMKRFWHNLRTKLLRQHTHLQTNIKILLHSVVLNLNENFLLWNNTTWYSKYEGICTYICTYVHILCCSLLRSIIILSYAGNSFGIILPKNYT